MNTVDSLLADNRHLAGSLRILSGKTHQGKRSVYISGTPDGLRLLAKLIETQADEVEARGHGSFAKFERGHGSLFFATNDSVELMEVHGHLQQPQDHVLASVAS